MPNSIEFYKGIFLDVIPVCIIFPWSILSFLHRLQTKHTYNPVQNIFKRIEKSSIVRQKQKTLISVRYLGVLFEHMSQIVVSAGETEHYPHGVMGFS